MERVERTRFTFGDGSKSDQIQWFAAAEQPVLPVAEGYEEYMDALASAPRKVDILLRFDGTPGAIQSDLLEGLAHHPKVGRIIIYGLPRAQRTQFAALAALLGVSIRFCDSEDEANILLHKRRSRTISSLMLDAPAVSARHH